MVRVAVGLGSNIGDSSANLDRAVSLLGEVFGELKISSQYITSPMYVEAQPEFTNAALTFNTEISPRRVLQHLKQIEQRMGREASERFGPRCIDLDLLLYGRLIYEHQFDDGRTLQIPHPRMTERAFVMVPLAEIAVDWVIPGLGKVGDLADNRFEGQHIRPVRHANV